MADSQRIVASIYRAIDEINQQLPPDKRLDKTDDTVLYARNGKLDSLGIVNLILLTEEAVEDDFGVQLELTSALQSTTSNPFRDVRTLAEHISGMLNGA